MEIYRSPMMAVIWALPALCQLSLCHFRYRTSSAVHVSCMLFSMPLYQSLNYPEQIADPDRLSQDSFVVTTIKILYSRLLEMIDQIEQGIRYDVVVVEAGLQGLAAAKPYLQIEPQTSSLIVGSIRSIGGIWTGENVNPGLRI